MKNTTTPPSPLTNNSIDVIHIATFFTSIIKEQNFPDSVPQLVVVEVGGLEVASSLPEFIDCYQNLLYENSNSLKFYQIRLIPAVYFHCEQT